MPITTEQIRSAVDDYLAGQPDQASYLSPLTDLLSAGAQVTARDAWDGHVTVSAVVTDAAGRVLVIEHRKYGGLRIQPGGHLDPDDRTLLGAALRELAEETGLRDVRVLSARPIHIAVHHVPAFPDRGELAHPHFDIRYGFTTTADIGRLDRSEVDGAAWLHPQEVENASLRDAVACHAEIVAGQRPDGEAEAYQGPRHSVGVYLILQDADGRMLVALRSDQVGVSPDMWALPCGALEAGEDLASALSREALEELGITVDVEDLHYVHTAHVANAYGSTLAVYFTATRWTGQVLNAEPERCRELMWLPPGQPRPVPFVEHVELVLDRLAGGPLSPYTAIGWSRQAVAAGAA